MLLSENYTIYDSICDNDTEITFTYSFTDKQLRFSNDSRVKLTIKTQEENNSTTPFIDDLIKFLSPVNKEHLKNVYLEHINLNKVHFSIGFHSFSEDGGRKMMYLKSIISYNPDGSVASIMGIIFYLDKSNFCLNCVEDQSYIDYLTGLPNHKAYSRDMSEILNDSNEKGYVILIDLDNISYVNMMYNYAVGDKVIWYVGNNLMQLIKEYKNSVYSLKSNQYLIVLPDITNETATNLMSKMQSYFKREMLEVDANSIRVTMSSAAVEYFGGIDTSDRLILNAKVVIDKIKDDGKDNYGTYTRGDGIRYMQQFELANKIKQAIDAGFKGFELYYQPIFSAHNDKCIGAEALLRWHTSTSEEQKTISPNIIIPILERTGLMPEVEKWILNTACSTVKGWIDLHKLDSNFFIHVNLSPRQITRNTLTWEVMDAIVSNGISNKNLILEITETSMMLEMDKGKNLLNELRENGVKIAVDDFGTGYSSLSYLRSLSIDEIKIDRSFVNDIEKDPSSRDFLAGIIRIIQSTGYIVCVEGVETEMQKKILTGLKVDMLQGYLFDKPVPSHIFENKHFNFN